MWRWLIPLAVACAVAVALVKASQHPTHVTIQDITNSKPAKPGPGAPCGTARSAPATYRHVIWILLGPRSFHEVIGKHTKALYVNSLARECGLATSYTSITHPELPNIVASVAGSPAGLTRNRCDPCRTSVRSVFTQVPDWAVYAESMPAPCATRDAPAEHYVARRNPATFFGTVRCRAHDVPLGTPGDGALARALDADRLPRLAVVVPDECHSMGFDRSCGVDRAGEFVALGDLWLESWMHRILGSPAYRSGQTAIFLTWSDGSPPKPVEQDCVRSPVASCHVAALVVAPAVKPGTTSAQPFTHYSLLRTTEMLLGVHRYLGGAASAPPMRAAFGL
jgi:hypothetical protein